jgi:integrase
MATILQFNQLNAKPEKREGSIRKKKGSDKLYVDFHYHGVRIVKSTGLADTPSNRIKAREWLNRNLEKIANGTFVFAQAFPGGSGKEKEFFALKEGWNYSPEPRQILFGEYVEKWMKEILSDFHSEGKRRDFKQVIDYWLLPYFKQKTFHQITGVELKKFLAGLKWQDGKNKGQLLSRSRVKNVLIPLRAIWNDACEEHRWDLPDPFRFLRKHLPDAAQSEPDVFRFHEWIKLVEAIDPHYRPIAEIMIMTGMIGSEIAGLRKEDIRDGYIHIQNSIVRKCEKSNLKTKYRKRKMPITKAIRERLDLAIASSSNQYVFTMKSGEIFNVNAFRKTPWSSAIARAGLSYRVPYAARHSLAAWALVLRVDQNRLVSLMGHNSKQMVYEVYGNYVEGLEKDADQILEYFGNDFIGLSN